LSSYEERLTQEAGVGTAELPSDDPLPAQGRERVVVCMKWGRKFPGDDVNRLYRMVRRWLPGDFRFLCLTDDDSGFAPEVEARPIPQVPVVGHRNDHGWKKLGLFGYDLEGVQGEALYLDLDVVIVDDLSPFFGIEGKFRIIKDYRPFRLRHYFTGNSSVVRFRVGEHGDLIRMVEEYGDELPRAFRNEQEVLSHYAREKGILQYWPREWCPSFKHDCVPPIPLGWFVPPRKPDGAKVIIFHGRPQPEEAVRGQGSKWYRVIKPTPWLEPYLG
jgi:hypothetical protein